MSRDSPREERHHVGGLAVAAEVVARLDAREGVISLRDSRRDVLERAHVTPLLKREKRATGRGASWRNALITRSRSKHVNAALQLFDSIGQRLGLTSDDRTLLSDAALLHDIGYHISYDKHNKHSYHLIEHADLLGITPGEQIIVANVARYHRGAEPKKKHVNYGGLEKSMRQTIKKLAGILRVADGFDRGHSGAVAEIKVRWLERAYALRRGQPPEQFFGCSCGGPPKVTAFRSAGFPADRPPDGPTTYKTSRRRRLTLALRSHAALLHSPAGAEPESPESSQPFVPDTSAVTRFS